MSKEGKSKSDGKPKIFVLDTSVILYDHNAFENFQEHDVAIPIQVLEELDNMKSGNDTRNFEARSFIRLLFMSLLREISSIRRIKLRASKFRVSFPLFILSSSSSTWIGMATSCSWKFSKAL